MNLYAFRKLLGPRGRRAGFVALGAKISTNVVLGARVTMRLAANVSIGAGTVLSGRVRIDSWGAVMIGRCCVLNDDILLLTAQHDINAPDFAAEIGDIVIGDYAWLPVGIVILPGVTVGDGAVVGTGSVVTRDVRAYEVVAGNPARTIGTRAQAAFTYVPAQFQSEPWIRFADRRTSVWKNRGAAESDAID